MTKHKTLAELAVEAGPRKPYRRSWFDQLSPEQQQEVREFRQQADKLGWSRREAHRFLQQHSDIEVGRTSYSEWCTNEQAAEDAGGKGD